MEKFLGIREQLLAIEEGRISSVRDYPAREVLAEGRAMIRRVPEATDE
jgi:hypothetical protein